MKRTIVALALISVAGCIPATMMAIPPNPVVPFPNHHDWILLADLNYQIGDSDTILTVPQGFVTDYASVPRAIWSLASPHDVYSEPSIVHDYLYWTQSCTRLQADNIFLIAMKEAEVDPKIAWAVYGAVRAGGQSSWDSNADEYKAGLPRVVPIGDEKLTAKSSWLMLRAQLSQRGVRDTMPTKNLAYCALGDTTEVPAGFEKIGFKKVKSESKM